MKKVGVVLNVSWKVTKISICKSEVRNDSRNPRRSTYQFFKCLLISGASKKKSKTGIFLSSISNNETTARETDNLQKSIGKNENNFKTFSIETQSDKEESFVKTIFWTLIGIFLKRMSN